MTDRYITPDDHRRAAALILHNSRKDFAGMNAIIDEANEDDRQTQMLLGVLDLYDHLLPELRTRLGQLLMNDAVVDLAGMYDRPEEGPGGPGHISREW